MKSVLIPAVLCFGLAGCTFGPDGAAQRASINAMDWDAADQPLVVMDLPARNVVAVLGLVGQNDGATTWASGDRRGLVLKDGIVIRSAGFGNDLIATDPAPVLAALDGGARSYARAFRHMTADNRIVDSSHTCTMAAPVAGEVTVVGHPRTAMMWAESCATPEGPVTNRYWRSGGRMVAAEQWISGPLGSVKVEFPTD